MSKNPVHKRLPCLLLRQTTPAGNLKMCSGKGAGKAGKEAHLECLPVVARKNNKGEKLLEQLWGQLRMDLVLLWFFALLTLVALLWHWPVGWSRPGRHGAQVGSSVSPIRCSVVRQNIRPLKRSTHSNIYWSTGLAEYSAHGVYRRLPPKDFNQIHIYIYIYVLFIHNSITNSSGKYVRY